MATRGFRHPEDRARFERCLLFGQPNQIDGDPDGSGFVVGYGDYISPVQITDDVEQLQHGRQLALALQASPGADAASPKAVDHQNISGSLEDDFVRYECRLRLSPENVLALRGTRFVWTDAAERLAISVPTSADAVVAVRRTMAELARENVRIDNRYSAVLRQLSAAEKGTAEAVALSEELTMLMALRAAI